MIESALYLVATPIGNLDDITYRAVKILNSVDLILAEDTRHSGILLNRLDIHKRCESYHDFNKEKKTPGYIEFINSGKSIALISDAGTPGISDPGFYISRAAREIGLKVIPVPGACAFIAAISASGLPTDHFTFSGFPPKKSARRLRELEQLKELWAPNVKHAPTIGYYIGPKQLKKFLNEFKQSFGGDHRIVLARELTKKFEEFLDNTVDGHLSYYSERNPKGEYVLLFHPQNKS